MFSLLQSNSAIDPKLELEAVIKSRDGDVQCQRSGRRRRANQGVFDRPYMDRLTCKGKMSRLARGLRSVEHNILNNN
jgi:hypothetical protein